MISLEMKLTAYGKAIISNLFRLFFFLLDVFETYKILTMTSA